MLGMILTLIKPVNTFLIGLFLWSNYTYMAALWIQVLMFCDIVDGILFRKSSWAVSPPLWWKTQFGINDLGWFRRVCDIVGDRLAVEVCLIMAIVWYDFPIILYAVELARDLFLLVTWLYGKYRKKVTLQNPNLLSRIAMFTVGLMGTFWLLGFQTAAFHLVWVLIVCGMLGASQYLLNVTFFVKAVKFEFVNDVMEMGLWMMWMILIAVLIVGTLFFSFKDPVTVLTIIFGFSSIYACFHFSLLFYLRKDIEELPEAGFVWRFADKHFPKHKKAQ